MCLYIRISFYFYFFIYVCYRWLQKNDRGNFHIFLKISLAEIVEIVDLALKVVIDSPKMYNMNFLTDKKNFETDFIMCKALFRVARPNKTKKILLLLLLMEVLAHVNHVFKEMSFKYKCLFKIQAEGLRLMTYWARLGTLLVL